MDNVNDRIPYSVYRDVDTTNFVNGDRVFADNNTGKWTIYEKTDPYQTNLLSSPDTDENQEFGYQVVARNDGKTLVVSSPGLAQGYVHFFYRSENHPDNLFYPV